MSDLFGGFDLRKINPEEEVGSIEFSGWAGLYPNFPAPGWSTILQVSPESESEDISVYKGGMATIAWDDLVERFTVDHFEPPVDDLVISQSDSGWYLLGELHPTFMDAHNEAMSLKEESSLIWLDRGERGFLDVTEKDDSR